MGTFWPVRPIFVLLWLSYQLYIYVSRNLTLFVNFHLHPGKGRPRIAVIGGGFAGTLAARYLGKRGDVSVVLFDSKDYFEYVPSVLRAMVYPDAANGILLPWSQTDLRSLGVVVRTTHVSAVDLDSGLVVTQDDETAESFDYFVLTCGSTYAEEVIKDWNCKTPHGRVVSLHQEYEKIERAQRIVLGGGGTVGVELAAELASRYSSELKTGRKQVTLVTPCPLLNSQPPKAGILAEKWLSARGVHILHNDRVVKMEQTGQECGQVMLRSGLQIPCDTYYQCVGVTPTTPQLMQHGCCDLENPPLPQTEGHYYFPPADSNQLAVNSYLQVTSHPNTFVAGDVLNAPPLANSCSAKTAFFAEETSRLAAYNLGRLVTAMTQRKNNRQKRKSSLFGLFKPKSGRDDNSNSSGDETEGGLDVPLLPCEWVTKVSSYPGTRAGRLPSLEIVSLGSWNAIMIFNRLVLSGILASLMKFVVFWTKMDQLRGGLLGNIVWDIMDTMAPFGGLAIPMYKKETDKEPAITTLV